MPTMLARKGGKVVTAWSERQEFPIITTYGFLKIDALSTDGLTVQAYACELIRREHGRNIDFEDVKQFPVIADPRAVETEVIEAFGQGRTLGVFQFGKRGITKLLKDIQPDWLGDVVAANAMYRPGALDMGTTWLYAKRKRGDETWSYPVAEMAPILDPTYGIIAYQEQVIAVASLLGGYSKAEADLVRKSITKLHSTSTNERRGERQLAALYERYIAYGTGTLKLSKKALDEVWDWLKAFARYGFNKGHSSGYALQAYQDMWLKVHYPVEFYASLMTYEPKRLTSVIREATSVGVELLPPNVSKSTKSFDVDDAKIRFGLTSIHDVGTVAVKELVDNAPYSSYDDLVTRTVKRRVNSKVRRALLESGAFDSWGGRESWMLDENGERVPADPLTWREKRELEQARLGYALTKKGDEMTQQDLISERVSTQDEVEMGNEGDTVTVGGTVTKVREFNTKKGDAMAHIELEHGFDSYKVTFFSRLWTPAREVMQEGEEVLVMGRLDEDSKVLAGSYTTVEELSRELEAIVS
jgi:DNA polymerase-3 subunit alpha